MTGKTFTDAPSQMDKAQFMAVFGGIYEHSPWVAERSWEKGVTAEHDRIEALAATMAEVLAEASRAEQLDLINAHPDLAGKAAMAGELTQASTGEQASAGLDQCSAEEFEKFTRLNDAYKEKFGFPFIMAVKGRHRSEILDAFETRLEHDETVEFQTALDQINRIALLRLNDL